MYKLIFTYETYQARTPILQPVSLQEAIQILLRFKDNPVGELENEIDSILADFDDDELKNYLAWNKPGIHYHTKRIIEKVSTNPWNQEMNIKTSPADEYGDWNDPSAPHNWVDQLETLFNTCKADIIFETIQGYDDEGRDCYQAYVIKPEHKSHFNDYWDANYERDGKMLYQLAIMEYITKYPQNLITIWAGPF